MLNNTLTNLSFIDESIQPLVNQILSYDKFGVHKRGLNISQVKINHHEVLRDQFTLSIPYANKNFKCDVLFDLNYPQLGPDFIFEDESFFSDPTSHDIVENLPSLAKWNVEDENALLNVVKELANYYKQHQLEICEHNGSRLRMEYDMLVPATSKAEDVEVVFTDKIRQEACFFVHLNLNFSSLPYRKLQLFKDMATLVITFQGQEWSHRTPQLKLTEHLKEILQNYSNFRLPVIDDTHLLIDYVPEVTKLLQETINTISTSFEYKQNFIACLKTFQPINLIEYDSEDYSYITVLLQENIQTNSEDKKYLFLVKFTLPERFPKDRPEIMLNNVYYLNTFRVGHPVKDFDYSPSWTVKEMITSFIQHIVNKELNKYARLSEEKKY